jgi:hypothetical protein
MKRENSYKLADSALLSAVLLSMLAIVLAVNGRILGACMPDGFRLSKEIKIVTISAPVRVSDADRRVLADAGIGPFSQPPMAGFSPRIAITTSNKRSYDDFDFEHKLAGVYLGSPLNPPAEQNFVIGILDTGSVVDLVAGPAAVKLGLTGSYLTQNEFPIGGISGTIYALLTQPIGVFVGSLSTVQIDGHLDLTKVVGHTNVSMVVSPEISCENGEEITAVVGTPMIAFYTTVINNDRQVRAVVGDVNYIGPDVQILDPYDPSIPEYNRLIPIELSGFLPMTTANYYPDFEDLETPMFPTLLSMSPLSIPFGGSFFTEINVLEGEPGPINPIQTIRVLVDTGAQSSIISSNVVAQLNMPFEPDFTAEVCGIGGLQKDVPGYYIDYVRINALGGALEFSRAPFVVLDMESPEGGPLDGVLGMNFFWNRNIILEPSFSGGSALHVSDPVPYAYIDLDFNDDVNIADFAVFAAAWQSTTLDENWNPYCDIYIDEVIDFRDLEAFTDAWLNTDEP